MHKPDHDDEREDDELTDDDDEGKDYDDVDFDLGSHPFLVFRVDACSSKAETSGHLVFIL